jgi:two-component system, OmpR family, sensor histidine kinase CiaH
MKNLLNVLLMDCLLRSSNRAAYGHLLAGRGIIPIKQSFSRQREFVADASHELRTPLSILKHKSLSTNKNKKAIRF